MPMTPAQARVIDPILTAVARGYLSPAAPAANALFPLVPVGQRGGRIITFGPDAFRLVSSARAPGSNTKRLQYSFGSQPYGLVDHSLEGLVPIELQQEAETVPGIDLGEGAVRNVQNSMALERERAAAVLATTAGNYDSTNKVTLSGAGQWTNDGSDPALDIDNAKEVIRGKTGVKPNKLVVSPKVMSGLVRNKSLIAKISDSEDKVLRPDQVARFLNIDEVVEAGAMYHDGTKFVDVWGNFAVLAYTTPKSLQEMGSPSYGYTYQLTGYPDVEEPYYERNPKSWIYPVTDAYQPQLVGPSAGFLFTNPVATS